METIVNSENNIWDELYKAKLKLNDNEPQYIQVAEWVIEYIKEDKDGKYLPMYFDSKWIRHEVIENKGNYYLRVLN